jgi:PIN domain nuclease of toxin-antitoxin system
MLNLDTHIVLHMLSGGLTKTEEKILRHEPLGISSIVFWEIARLHEGGRISIGLDNPQLRDLLSNLHVWEIDIDVCEAMVLRLDFKSDPADELIAATSVLHNAPLVTRDAQILASQTVPFAIPPAKKEKHSGVKSRQASKKRPRV